MIVKVESKEQLNICLEIIRRSFQTVADEWNLTKDNCPSYTAFIPMEKLLKQFESAAPMFLYEYESKFVGYFSLSVNNDSVVLNHLAVIPEFRHIGIGKKLVDYAIKYSKSMQASKIKIGIVEENHLLKDWYKNLGFVHIKTKKFMHLPFTVGFMEMEL